jgi:hypothetical protein
MVAEPSLLAGAPPTGAATGEPIVEISDAAAPSEPYVEYEDAEEEDEDDSQWETEAAAMASQFESLVSLGPLNGGGGGGSAAPKISQAAGSSLRGIERKAARGKEHTGLTRDERATVEQVLDPRTRLLLFKLINSGTLESINGCVSTGKEANVYHAFGPPAAAPAPSLEAAAPPALSPRRRRLSASVRASWHRRRRGRRRVRGQSLQDVDPRLPRSRPLRLGRVSLPARLLQGQPAQDGACDTRPRARRTRHERWTRWRPCPHVVPSVLA